MDRSDALKAVALLQEAYRRNDRDDWTPATTELYVRYMLDLPAKLVAKAIDRLILTHKFRPSVAEIREAVAEIACPVPDPDEAYAEVRHALSAPRFVPNGHGSYDTDASEPEWSDPAIKRAIDAIGWWRLKDGRSDDNRRAFMSLYPAIVESERERRKLRPQVADSPDLRLVEGGSQP